jgi:hypothetical protein
MFVLWRFVGLQVITHGRFVYAKNNCYWKKVGTFQSVDAAIAEIDNTHDRCKRYLKDASWLIIHNTKVVFDHISDDGYIANIYTEVGPSYLQNGVKS